MLQERLQELPAAGPRHPPSSLTSKKSKGNGDQEGRQEQKVSGVLYRGAVASGMIFPRLLLNVVLPIPERVSFRSPDSFRSAPEPSFPMRRGTGHHR